VKALVTGADGFVGRWLVEHLEASGDEVWLAPGGRSDGGPRRRVVDLTDRSSVDALVEWAEPEAIYHLAAVAFGPDATSDIGHAVDVTVRGTAFLLDAAARLATPPRVLIPSSSEVYGRVGPGPVRESHPLEPVSPYGATKVAQESIALAFMRSRGVPVAVARAFNHIGPGQRPSFVVPSFAAQLAHIARDADDPVIRVGNLGAERDFTDVRDVVRAYRLLVVGGHHGQPINVASGSATRVRDLLEALIETSGVDVTVEVDPSRLRAIDVPSVVGDAELLTNLTGWRPAIALSQTLADIWDDAVQRARSRGRLA
jgi:GDP-4-dehydro-6-deoxy-D-mannose reductase